MKVHMNKSFKNCTTELTVVKVPLHILINVLNASGIRHLTKLLTDLTVKGPPVEELQRPLSRSYSKTTRTKCNLRHPLFLKLARFVHFD